jgi:hypothetical protein
MLDVLSGNNRRGAVTVNRELSANATYEMEAYSLTDASFPG